MTMQPRGEVSPDTYAGKAGLQVEERLTYEQFRHRIENIVASMKNHLGRKALVIWNDGRNRIPVIGTLKCSCGKVLAEYQHYTKDGTPCGMRSLHVNPALVHTGEISVDYLDDGV